MLGLEQIRMNRNIVNAIDWSMTPEKACEPYFEGRTGVVSSHSNVLRRQQTESIYFVLYDCEQSPLATLIRRTTDGVDQIGKILVPADLFQKAFKEAGYRSGVGAHPLNWELKEWLRNAVDAPTRHAQVH